MLHSRTLPHTSCGNFKGVDFHKTSAAWPGLVIVSRAAVDADGDMSSTDRYISVMLGSNNYRFWLVSILTSRWLEGGSSNTYDLYGVLILLAVQSSNTYRLCGVAIVISYV